jgi:hypothetical protein
MSHIRALPFIWKNKFQMVRNVSFMDRTSLFQFSCKSFSMAGNYLSLAIIKGNLPSTANMAISDEYQIKCRQPSLSTSRLAISRLPVFIDPT